VTLFEAESELGGQLRLAARLPQRENFLEVIRYLSSQAHKQGVDARLSCRVDARAVEAESPDAVVVATGVDPLLPRLNGQGQHFVHAWDVVAGTARFGERVLVVDADGHLRGCGTADFLAERGKFVRIASDHLYVGRNIDLKTLYPLYRRLREQGVEMLPSTRFEGWEDGVPVVSDVFTGLRRSLPDVDTVVWAAPGRSRDELVEPLRQAGLVVHAIGDCVAPRRLEHAVREGHQVARAI
jgi:NADPH-dependent 2,4-dienoyl-CoA reductase/sulfur reductase-like enzyme